MSLPTSLSDLTLVQARDGLQSKAFSSQELTSAFLEQIKAQADLNAFVHVAEEQALAQAQAFDQGQRSGPLAGLPLGIKDLFCTQGLPTTAASNILRTFVPPYESTVTGNLLQAGAVFLGKLNLDEFAMGSSNTTSAFGPVKNPLKAKDDTELCRVPGGSSGGSAAAVAAGLCLAATGTDTGGSIRQPAAFCGIVGIKPTYGRCSRWGIVAFASSLDQAGPMTRTVSDAALMLETMAGHDVKDSTSAPQAVPSWYKSLDPNRVKGLTVGIPKEYRVEGMPAAVVKSWEDGIAVLREAGAEIKEVSLPHTQYALPTYYIIAPAEASSNLARYDGMRYGVRVEGESLIDTYQKTRGAGFGTEVKRRIMIGTYALSSGYYDAYYLKAQQVRALIRQDFLTAFSDVDVLLTPTTPSEAFKIGENEEDPVKMYLNDVLTVPASLAGLPALSVPFGTADNGLPLGLHLIGKPFDEQTILDTGLVLEAAGASA